MTDSAQFGIDPISGEKAEIRRKPFEETFPSTDVVLNELVNGRPQMFQDMTKRLNLS